MEVKTDIWMPLYVRDYTADTIGLTLAEHGAYLLSLMAYWMKGESLTAVELRAICGKEIDRVSKFFVMEGHRWHHKRVDEELKRARQRREIARLKAQKSVEARRKKGLLPR